MAVVVGDIMVGVCMYERETARIEKDVRAARKRALVRWRWQSIEDNRQWGGLLELASWCARDPRFTGQ